MDAHTIPEEFPLDPITDFARKSRFPIERELQYRAVSKRGLTSGSGTTITISSASVVFAASAEVEEGADVEVSISWPVALDGRLALRLIARGFAAACEDGQVAMEIQQYEFRTQAPAAKLGLRTGSMARVPMSLRPLTRGAVPRSATRFEVAHSE